MYLIGIHKNTCAYWINCLQASALNPNFVQGSILKKFKDHLLSIVFHSRLCTDGPALSDTLACSLKNEDIRFVEVEKQILKRNRLVSCPSILSSIFQRPENREIKRSSVLGIGSPVEHCCSLRVEQICMLTVEHCLSCTVWHC